MSVAPSSVQAGVARRPTILVEQVTESYRRLRSHLGEGKSPGQIAYIARSRTAVFGGFHQPSPQWQSTGASASNHDDPL